MDDAKHTPGPWVTQINVVNYRSGRRALEVRGKGDELVATLPGRGNDAVDGRLIATAPDMLDMLRKALAGLEFARGYVENDNLLAEIDALIAKATGDAS